MSSRRAKLALPQAIGQLGRAAAEGADEAEGEEPEGAERGAAGVDAEGPGRTRAVPDPTGDEAGRQRRRAGQAVVEAEGATARAALGEVGHDGALRPLREAV